MMFYGDGQFPYTNFHELNLDWILKKIKELSEDNSSIHVGLEELSTELDNMSNNMTEQINTQLHAMIDDGTFAELLTNYSGFVKQFETTTAMMADTHLEPGVIVQTGGYYSAGDGGHGTFIVTSTPTDFPLGNNYYAFLLDPIDNVLAYGAKADGLTDCTTALNHALANSPVIRLPKKTDAYLIGAVNIPEGRSIIGDATEIWPTASTIFTITKGHTNIENFIFRGLNYTPITIDLADASEFIYISDIKAYDCTNLINDNSNYNFTNFYMSRCYGINVTGTGVEMHKGLAFIFLDDITIDIIRSMPNAPCFRFTDCRGMQLRHCEAEGGRTEGHIHQLYNVGFSFDRCVAVWLDRCMADTLDGIGFEVSNTCEYFYFSQCVASLCGSHAFMLAGKYLTFTNCFANGNLTEEYPLQNVHAFNIYSDVVMSACRAVGFTGAGIYVHSTGVIACSTVMGSYLGIGILGSTGGQGVIQGCVMSATTATQDIPTTLHLINNQINNTFA